MSSKLIELAKEMPGLSINANFADLVAAFREVAKEHKKELEEIVISEKAETYPTPKQVCEILGVDNSTLWRYKKRNYLVPIEVGGKRRYRMSDIKKILNGGKQALQNQK
ncbi:MAG: helix-turn-helix domain-containing protein [Prolixibacteraceae bacterium]